MLEQPIKEKKVSKYVYAYLYPNGTINIEGIKYLFYTMTQAIKKHRQDKREQKKTQTRKTQHTMKTALKILLTFESFGSGYMFIAQAEATRAPIAATLTGIALLCLGGLTSYTLTPKYNRNKAKQ